MSDGQARRAVLLPAGEDDGDFERLAIAGDLYLDLVAGFSGAVDVAPAVKGGQVRFLKKPFFPAELIKLLREMLEDRAERA